MAHETRKPRRYWGLHAPQVDQDGIWQVWIEDPERLTSYSDWAKGAWITSVATCLNMKRVLRNQIEPRLRAMQAQLEGLERKLDRLSGVLAKDGTV